MPADRAKPLIDWATRRLMAVDCETPQLDARLLFQYAAHRSREDIILNPHAEVLAGDALRFRELIARREAHEPISRIMGEREFYGRVFQVTPAVLDPRPDTETLIDAALGFMGSDARVLDLGTGSGAIIVTLLAEKPEATGLATDLSPAALAVARINAERLGVAPRLRLAEGCWFAPVSGKFDLIVSNPPYIAAGDIAGLEPGVRNFDPVLALSGGVDGLDPYRAIAHGASPHVAEGGIVLVEIGAGQADAVETIFTAHFTPAGRFVDLGGHVRCLAFR